MTMDTPREVIAQLKPLRISGLYFMYNGEKVMPNRVWFGCGKWINNEWHSEHNGYAWCHYDNALRAVYTKGGQHFRLDYLSNVQAQYDNVKLTDWKRGE